MVVGKGIRIPSRTSSTTFAVCFWWMLFLVVVVVVTAEPSELCMADDLKIRQDDALNSKFMRMLRQYSATCAKQGKCSLGDDDPFALIISQQYDGFTEAMEQSCERSGTHQACLLHTKIRLDVLGDGDGDGGKGGSGVGVVIDTPLVGNNAQGERVSLFEASAYLTEHEKPICVPNACSRTNNHLKLIEPESLICRQEGLACEVESYGLQCPDNDNGNGNSNPKKCEEDALSPAAFFNLLRSTQEMAVVTDCVLVSVAAIGEDNLHQFLAASDVTPPGIGPASTTSSTSHDELMNFLAAASSGTHGNLCQFTTGAMDTELTTDFTKFVKDSIDQEKESQSQAQTLTAVTPGTAPIPVVANANAKKSTFGSYKRRCKNVNGKLCRFSGHLHVHASGEFIVEYAKDFFPIASAEDVNTGIAVTNLPFCMSPSCTEQDMNDPAFIMAHVNQIIFKDAPMSCDDLDCTVDVKTLDCPFFEDDLF